MCGQAVRLGLEAARDVGVHRLLRSLFPLLSALACGSEGAAFASLFFREEETRPCQSSVDDVPERATGQ